MKYLITQDQLYRVFVRFLHQKYGELVVDGIMIMNTKNPDLNNRESWNDFGYLDYLADGKKTEFGFYYDSKEEITFENIFGSAWSYLLLTYLQERFPRNKIVNVK